MSVNTKSKLNYFLTAVFGVLCSGYFSVQGQVVIRKSNENTAVKTDTTKNTAVKKGPKKFDEVINSNAVRQSGLLNIYVQDSKYYGEIPLSLLGKDILVVARISRSAAGFRAATFGYAGDLINESVVRFTKGPAHKVYLRTVIYLDRTQDTTSSLYASVERSNLQAVAASFDILAYTETGNAIIDLTDYLNGDNDLFFFDNRLKTSLKLGSLASDKSYIDTLRTYPENVEIKTVKTYTRAALSNVTLELNTSLLLLPKQPMKPRLLDKRVGYFASGFYDFDQDPHGVQATYYVRRWRLEPKPEDISKYKKGILVKPQKPIVIYIDPATPKKWVPYLIQGINDWQKAFEKAGFKEAIVGREAPSKREDSTWSLEDARYSVLVYKPSAVANASGPHVADPRTGEILETHINWYHNVMKLLQSWYFVQCGAVDPDALDIELKDELMGELIRFVSSHEVGHTLGLRHNFGSSSTVPVELLRNKQWVEKNGHTPSIMDYARFNYVAQPEDGISRKGLFPRIGIYDEWAIEWGYRWSDEFSGPYEEAVKWSKWTTRQLENKMLWFGPEDNIVDPRSQSEDLGDDAMKAGMYGIKNLQRLMEKLPSVSKKPLDDYSFLRSRADEIRMQFQRYIYHAVKYVGGAYVTSRITDEKGEILKFVPKAKQQDALRFVADHLFLSPEWLYPSALLPYTGQAGHGEVLNMQGPVLNKLINGFTFDRLLMNYYADTVLGYHPEEYLKDIYGLLFDRIPEKDLIGASGMYKRNLQKLYIEKFNSLLNQKAKSALPAPGLGLENIFPQGIPSRTTDVTAFVQAHLNWLKTEFDNRTMNASSPEIRIHWKYLSSRIPEILQFKEDNIF